MLIPLLMQLDMLGDFGSKPGGGGTAWGYGKLPRYWWQKDPTDIPDDLEASEDIEQIQVEMQAVQRYVTDLVIQRAAEETIRIMRAYAELLYEQLQQRMQAIQSLITEKKAEEAIQKVIQRKRKIMLLLS